MLTHDAFGKLLHLPKPWLVDRMEIDPQSQESYEWLTHGSTCFACPKCHHSSPVHDHTAERTWRHLDLWKAKTFSVATVSGSQAGDVYYHAAPSVAKTLNA